MNGQRGTDGLPIVSETQSARAGAAKARHAPPAIIESARLRHGLAAVIKKAMDITYSVAQGKSKARAGARRGRLSSTGNFTDPIDLDQDGPIHAGRSTSENVYRRARAVTPRVRASAPGKVVLSGA